MVASGCQQPDVRAGHGSDSRRDVSGQVHTIEVLRTLDEADIDRLQALRMACNIPGQEAQALSEHRVIAFGGHGAGQHYLATGADCVVNRVALPEPKGTTHGFRHRGLVAVGKRGFDSKSLKINSMHTQIV